MRRVSSWALVVDNLQSPVPPWQQGLPEKEPIELFELVADFDSASWTVRRCVPVNVIDRRLFLHRWVPRPVAYAVTRVLDRVLSRLVDVEDARYVAVLFEAPG
jgi:hypothetical protein